MSWLNEPRDWSLENGVLRAVTELRTDFWCETFYGWTTDNGHFFYQPTTGDFTAEVIVSATHTTRFDQAGMMIRADERNWLKAGLEVTSGAVQISTVFTREFSDVSIAPIAAFPARSRCSGFGDA
jgi:regulation of enolase protein 1 (concanavalin A-like superfamily)